MKCDRRMKRKTEQKRIDKKAPKNEHSTVRFRSFSPVANCSHFRITLELESKMCLPVRVRVRTIQTPTQGTEKESGIFYANQRQ